MLKTNELFYQIPHYIIMFVHRKNKLDLNLDIKFLGSTNFRLQNTLNAIFGICFSPTVGNLEVFIVIICLINGIFRNTPYTINHFALVIKI